MRSNVKASMQQIFYKVLCMLYKDTGLILDGSCTYKASAMGRCSHISTLLFSMEDYIVNNRNMPVACTSQCCTWNKGAPIKTSVEVMAKQYSNKRDVSHIKEFKKLPGNDQKYILAGHVRIPRIAKLF